MPGAQKPGAPGPQVPPAPQGPRQEPLKSQNSLEMPKEEKIVKKPKNSEMIFVTELRARLDTYFRIVVRNIRDSIPKIIGHFLVHAVQDKMQMELFKRLNTMFDSLNRAMGEPEAVIEERKALTAQMEVLRKAERVLTRDPEITSLISTSDDELLMELKREKAEEAAGKKIDKKKVIEDCLHSVLPSAKQAPVVEHAKPVKQDGVQPRPNASPMTKPLENSPKVSPPTAPQAAPRQAPPQQKATEVKKSAKSNLFGL